MSQLQNNQPKSQTFYSIPVVATERWQCDEKLVYSEIQSGRLRAVRIGKKLLRVSLEELERYEAEFATDKVAA